MPEHWEVGSKQGKAITVQVDSKDTEVHIHGGSIDCRCDRRLRWLGNGNDRVVWDLVRRHVVWRWLLVVVVVVVVVLIAGVVEESLFGRHFGLLNRNLNSRLVAKLKYRESCLSVILLALWLVR